jgi:SAM-dependent methyltransferase
MTNDIPMIARPCPLCGSTDDSKIFADAQIDTSKLSGFAFASRKLPDFMHHRLVKCPDCDLVYSSPIPHIETLTQAYVEADYDSGEEARCAAHTYGQYLKQFVDRLPDRVGALDIGAGDGAFLEELLKQGFSNVVGVEPSAAPIRSAPDAVRPLLVQDIFRASEFKPGTFSLVTCFQTIEHVPDPAAMVAEALTLLKPGGALFLIGHNLNSVSAKVLRMKSPIFDVEHLQLFTLPTAKDLLHRGGYVKVEVQPIVNAYPLHYYLKLLPLPKSIKIPLMESARRGAAAKRTIPARLGNLMVFGFRSA